MAKAYVALISCLCVLIAAVLWGCDVPPQPPPAKEAVTKVTAAKETTPAAEAAQVQAKPAATQPKPVRPAWSELTAAQQQVLAPLREDWESLDATRRKKWVTIANRYPKMKAQEQQRLQARMKEWAGLAPEQRRAARERYLAIRKMPAEKRQELPKQWEEYQAWLAARTPDQPTVDESQSAAQ
jgi:hypothetical protein